MNISEREEKLRQIISGFFHFKFNDQMFKYFEPTCSFFSEISYYTKDIESQLKLNGFLSSEDEKKILIEKGLWSEAKQKELETCEKDLSKLKQEKIKYKYQSKHLKVIEATIKALEDKIEEMSSVRNSMYPNTIEYQRAYRINILILSEAVRNRRGEKIWSSVEELENNVEIKDIDKMLRLVNSFAKIDQKTLRDIARNEPWRTIWKTSCKTGTPLFNKPTSDLTKNQYELCYWSNVYDSVYESSDYPGQDVIEDDEKLDEWFVRQSEKYSSNKSKGVSGLNPKIANASEIFLPVDTPEDAQKVYEEMNSLDGRRIISKRNSAIEKAGNLTDDQLPDVKTNLLIEQNKQLMSKK